MKKSKFVVKYVGDHKKSFILFMAMFLLNLCLCYLYHAPAELPFYWLVLCLLFAGLVVGADFLKYIRKSRILEGMKKEVLYSQNLFEKLYPASTTKILTAYIIIKYGNLDDKVTVSPKAVSNLAGSSLCGVQAGDQLTVRDLLYGLMLVSGNDAANVLAEYYSGSVEKFAKVMNKEAKALGATKSHFVNANGLPDEKHYTSVYDMYLIFQEAIKLQDFVDIIKTDSIDVSYADASGNTVSKTWANTNQYLKGETQSPDGIMVIGGKTGTTNAAGYCLVLYSNNKKGEDIISIVYKSDGRSNMYLLMNQILSTFAN